MKEIKVLGTGCPKCKMTMKIVSQAAEKSGFSGSIEKIEDLSSILLYGVMTTPAVVIDGRVVFSGGVPSLDEAEAWFKEQA